MAPFFGKLRGNAGSGPQNSASSPAKKEKEIPPTPLTPLEKMLQDAGPLRNDGSDKFFGMENAQYGNTCYCNSILQCLYYSVPFRESVINYPRRSPIETLNDSLAKNLHYPDTNAQTEDAYQAKQKTSGNPALKSGITTPTQPQRPEDKESPEYKKKVAMNTLPILETRNNATSYGMQESLFTSLKDIFEAVVATQERIGVIRPYSFLEVLRREHEMFRTAMHQDAHEFLNLLLNEVVANVEAEAKRCSPPEVDQQSESGEASEHATTTGSVATTLTASNASKSPNTTRWVHELFEGTLTSETQCLTCEKVSQRDEVFLDLSVDLDQHSSVTSCLRKFSEEEMLCERNKFHCDNCGGLQEAEKRMKIKRLPRILALHLKRFKYTEDLQRLQKLFHRVVYPYFLRLFNTTDDAEDPDRLYELYAVVVHIGGGPYHGHYVAIIKTENMGWLLFDDEMVEPVDKNYVRNFFGDRPGLACAYVLFYQETTFEAMQREQENEGMTTSGRASVDTKDLVSSSYHKMNGSAASSNEINRVHTVIPATERQPISPLKRAPTAPQPSTHPENVVPVTPTTPPSPLNSKKSDVLSIKERLKEEKERKAKEKEKEKEKKGKGKAEKVRKGAENEKAEKQKRKDTEARLKEAKRQDAELKAALDASKASQAEEVRRNGTAIRNAKENGVSAAFTGGLGRFKLGSRSLSHGRFSKDKGKASKSSLEMPPIPTISSSTPPPSPAPMPVSTLDPVIASHAADVYPPNNWPLKEVYSTSTEVTTPAKFENPTALQTRLDHLNALSNHTKVRQSEELHNSSNNNSSNSNNHNDDRQGEPIKKAGSKRSRFSLRKKSFSVI
ncbi:ubiquitin carboxyl-terminal hydrolase [Paracoccidioides lutzii Pb01]|uniref:ubiquitinyl hydrolase 1 n=1 Tax=Paracoccidioides lutzii (strain ATCC MYA-826 / Pb01) TaxID=502779 RepID=C1H853_PARBA|nr:ubiquitin carboxyl-terminal hydrolase [Paracoccidioides lutzii Pb01]EEH36612.2 ubiquitin carboxyl-terminal hydrolase [Paracoccidioides lutzii Pb01]